MVLDAEAGVEEPQVLRHLGDGRDRRLARSAGDPLLDRHGRRDAGDAVDRGPGQLLDELPRVGRHRLHEAPLALRKDDVEGERGLARPGDAGDDVQGVVRDRERDVLQVVLAGSR